MQFCSLIGVSFKNPLGLTIEAGAQGLPTLLKLANIMAVKKQEWAATKQLPVAVELGSEFQFHSVFVCPVSRDQSSEDNPPMLLPCGHVLCNQSISKLSKNNTRMFKCPYCPFEAWVAQCRQLWAWESVIKVLLEVDVVMAALRAPASIVKPKGFLNDTPIKLQNCMVNSLITSSHLAGNNKSEYGEVSRFPGRNKQPISFRNSFL
ncbi:Zinc finger, RING/FYVE/PHD-type [Cynara cardunculus var. scolymus]|uniref:Zinc finger, RING/FYVE/PHD-type n=1 Tax=Cynara cardunculus var. scolymus TaxID=59895 RepID=A0A118DKR2_CYNCS|nr:Zinc finger, RING/FYVE/PHD-type [Cynara cardunculus var. scolymus]